MVALPYPNPSDPMVSKRMRSNRRRDTRPERALRTLLHARGLRYRVDFPLRLDALTARPDIAFTRWQVAVFVDGCFWHRCPDHGNVPRRNLEYWRPKLQRNVDRDQRVDAELRGAGWRVIRAWEHEPSLAVVDRIVTELSAAKGDLSDAEPAEPEGRAG